MEELATLLAFGMAFLSLIGGVLIIIAGMRQHTRKLEMQHRERLAMIERGLAPGPAADPEAFERASGMRRGHPPSRVTSIGVVIIALGFGLMLLIGFAGDAPETAVGVGGAIVTVGAAFIVIGELKRRTQGYAGMYRDGVMRPPPPDPYDPHGSA
jgi:uncharacterized membrane protein YphA (DoxX/SURF4 family)